MRPKFSFSNLIALAALGALAIMVATDPRFRELLSANWQWFVLLLGIIVLVMAQVILVRRNLYVLPAGRTHLAEPATPPTVQPALRPSSRKAPPDAESETADPPSEAPEDGGEEPGPHLDANLFTRFRQHLEQVEQEDPQKPAPNRAPASEEDVVDRVELSSASRRKAPKGGAGKKNTSGAENYAAFEGGLAAAGDALAASGGAEDEPDGPDLFSDLRPQPVKPPAGEEAGGNNKEAATRTDTVAPPRPDPGQEEEGRSPGPATEKSTETSAGSTTRTASDGGEGNGAHRVDAKPGVSADSPTHASALDGGVEGRTASPDADPMPGEAPRPPIDEVMDEVTEALAPRAGDSAEKSQAELAEEAAALLHLAEEAGRRGVWERLRATLENYLAHLAEAPGLVDWRARRLQVRLAVHDRGTGPALQAFEEMLTAGFRPEMDNVPPLLEELLEGGERKLADSLRVSMLVRILAAFRQRRDQPAMDLAYTWIEAAQERVGDEKRLLQYLKNHLEIRKAMGNVPGQLELIDQIGNRCFKLGLTDEAKTYYEMGLKLRGESQDDQAPTGDDGSAVG